jgi:hypothetical protein
MSSLCWRLFSLKYISMEFFFFFGAFGGHFNVPGFLERERERERLLPLRPDSPPYKGGWASGDN